MSYKILYIHYCKQHTLAQSFYYFFLQLRFPVKWLSCSPLLLYLRQTICNLKLDHDRTISCKQASRPVCDRVCFLLFRRTNVFRQHKSRYHGHYHGLSTEPHTPNLTHISTAARTHVYHYTSASGVFFFFCVWKHTHANATDTPNRGRRREQ